VENIKNGILWIFNYILDIIAPTPCVGCKKRGEIICDNCISTLRQAERETESNILACFDYRDEIMKNVIWNLKYHHRWSIARKLGKLLYENMIEEIAELEIYTQGSPIVVIPVPISKSKNKMRGYNQAEKIARSFCNSSPRKIFELRNNIVIKIKDTLPQAKIANRNKRLKNVQGVFIINEKYNPNSKEQTRKSLKGRTVIVIDDVTTTGGTITEIIKILKKNGVKKVIGLAVAH